MCLETFNHYRCGHIEYLDADPCPYLEEVHHLTQKRGRRFRDHRTDRLYERCEESQARRYLTVRSKCPCCDEDDERRARADIEVRDAGDDEEIDGASSDREDEYVGALRAMENERRARERQRSDENGQRSEEKELDRGKLSDEGKEKQHTPHTKTDEASTPTDAAESLSQSPNRQHNIVGNGRENSDAMQM